MVAARPDVGTGDAAALFGGADAGRATGFRYALTLALCSSFLCAAPLTQDTSQVSHYY